MSFWTGAQKPGGGSVAFNHCLDTQKEVWDGRQCFISFSSLVALILQGWIFSMPLRHCWIFVVLFPVSLWNRESFTNYQEVCKIILPLLREGMLATHPVPGVCILFIFGYFTNYAWDFFKDVSSSLTLTCHTPQEISASLLFSYTEISLN